MGLEGEEEIIAILEEIDNLQLPSWRGKPLGDLEAQLEKCVANESRILEFQILMYENEVFVVGPYKLSDFKTSRQKLRDFIQGLKKLLQRKVKKEKRLSARLAEGPSIPMFGVRSCTKL